MTQLVTYRASDRRVYEGAPCSDMSKEWEHTKYLEVRMKKADATARCTYFPMEDKYMVFTNSNILENPHLDGPPKQLTDFYADKQEALIEAIKLLET